MFLSVCERVPMVHGRERERERGGKRERERGGGKREREGEERERERIKNFLENNFKRENDHLKSLCGKFVLNYLQNTRADRCSLSLYSQTLQSA